MYNNIRVICEIQSIILHLYKKKCLLGRLQNPFYCKICYLSTIIWHRAHFLCGPKFEILCLASSVSWSCCWVLRNRCAINSYHATLTGLVKVSKIAQIMLVDPIFYCLLFTDQLITSFVSDMNICLRTLVEKFKVQMSFDPKISSSTVISRTSD